MKALVSGSNSILGKSICFKLIKNRIDVFAMYNISQPKKLLKNTKNLIKHNLLNDFFFDKKYDIFIHVASATPTSAVNRSEFLKINVIGYRNILKNAIKNGCKNFFLISTTSIYKNSKNGVLTERSEIQPQNYYAESKLKAEKLLIRYAKNYKLNYMILRLPAILEKNSRKNFISSLIDKVKKNEKIFIQHKNFKFNNMVHVDNVANIILDTIKLKQFKYIYNLGCIRPLMIKNIFNIISKKMKKNLKANYIESKQKPFNIRIHPNLKKNYDIYSCRKALSKLISSL